MSIRDALNTFKVAAEPRAVAELATDSVEFLSDDPDIGRGTPIHFRAQVTTEMVGTIDYTGSEDDETNTLLNDLKTQLNAHMADGVTAHSNDDDVNGPVATANATTRATAVALANSLRAAYEAHRVTLEDAAEAAVHGAADTTNALEVAAVASNASYVEIAALADDIREKYEAHRVLTTDSVHDAADNTNAASEAAIGTVTYTQANLQVLIQDSADDSIFTTIASGPIHTPDLYDAVYIDVGTELFQTTIPADHRQYLRAVLKTTGEAWTAGEVDVWLSLEA